MLCSHSTNIKELIVLFPKSKSMTLISLMFSWERQPYTVIVEFLGMFRKTIPVILPPIA